MNPMGVGEILDGYRYENSTLFHIKPRGKESTEVRISQNKRKESENSYQKNIPTSETLQILANMLKQNNTPQAHIEIGRAHV